MDEQALKILKEIIDGNGDFEKLDNYYGEKARKDKNSILNKIIEAEKNGDIKKVEELNNLFLSDIYNTINEANNLIADIDNKELGIGGLEEW